MEPYIDPSFFYWASVLDSLKTVLLVVGIFCLIAVGATFLCFALDAFNAENFAKNIRKHIKPIVITACIGVLCILTALFIPSEAVLTKMMVARAITPDNVSKGIETVKEAVDYIVQKIAEIK